MEKVLNDKKVVGYNLNTSKFSEEQNKEFDEKYGVTGTPTTIFIKDGEEVSLLQRINGEADSDKVIRKLQNNGYIK
jgi:thioredoxin-related protein